MEINEKNDDGVNPIFFALDRNNLEIFILLVEYSVEKKFKIIINEKDIEEIINSKKLCYVNLKNISEINPEFIKIIYLYKNKNIIEVIFSDNRYVFKKDIEYFINKKEEKERIEKVLKNEKKN